MSLSCYAAHARRIGTAVAILGAIFFASSIAVAQEAKNTPIPAGKARLVLNRVSGVLYVGVPAIVKVNGQEVATVWADKSAVVDIAPGAAVVSVTSWVDPGDFAVALKAKAGAAYTFEISPRIERVNLFGEIGLIGQMIDANTKKNTGRFSIRLVRGK